MASITLGTVRDYWKAVYDAIKAAGQSKPTNVLQVGGSDGTNLQPLAVTATGELKAQLIGRNAADLATRGSETIVAMRSGPLAASTFETLIDYSGSETHLEMLTLGSNSKWPWLRIHAYRDNGALGPEVKIADKTGSQMRVIRPETLQTHSDGENDFFLNKIYDEANGYFSLIMKRQMRFGNGLKVNIMNDQTTSINVAIQVVVYKMRA